GSSRSPAACAATRNGCAGGGRGTGRSPRPAPSTARRGSCAAPSGPAAAGCAASTPGNGREASCLQILRAPHQLLQSDVDHQPEPEGLEEVEDEAGLAVEDPQQEKIPVEEVERRPDEERQAVIAV